MYDIIIKNGVIIDGTGDPMKKADIGIKEGFIQKIGNLQNEKADKTIDARGQYVVPGFVDVNNHSDTYWRIFINPQLESLIYQGITTIIGGNCGSSLAPLVDREIIRSIQKWVNVDKINFNWLGMEDFFKEVETLKLSVNFSTLVGHGTLRRGVIQDQVREMTEEEFDKMKKMLKSAMKEGALGFSTGLVYTHAKQAKMEEIVELAKIVKKYDGVYATHIRGEGKDLIESIEEAIEVSQKTGVKMQISHLKVMGEENWHLMAEAINLVETARGNGIDVNFDVYPYTATGSVLYIFLPDWVSEGGRKMMLYRLKDPTTRRQVIAEMRSNKFDFSKITISISPLNKTLTRKKITDIAISQGKSVEETIVDILIASEGQVVTITEALSEKNIVKAIQHPFSIISSNGSGYSVDYKKTGELVHPRNFGSFPRVFFKYVRGERILSWEEAVHKMSGKPAAKFGLKKRGTLEVENFADVVVFDPEKIEDLATTENPYRYCVGITNVIVNGKIVMDQGRLTGVRAGEVIRSKNIKKYFDFF
ncbi:MAG: N-acyl-D-amino-acid deacylase [Candidatus Moranbacteria bacterium GW2011_GWE2_35_2-]|nr:MAG: N-acyl-D-amino-acid deacylase [Candidatus Moranbacteria bacterium GW2011_GWE2_35_2-]KKQ22753.1 MAG: N-acyl-D-amino-acid deacylase [Candidatus Moranbacteria bacterium GW2011_GWF2_37_11]KKQ28907.1 MAG: N-acyl-D-amino-acid deacylase [Candidatus Moranbacteria bacterium GW2011_GWD1_37_17]KKQ31016.1 MAG: N-acyl-D-amino-acid deacylase [Candidatus Moranbacteria bacterium GW2011_GWE1_37_24]KKQ48078.1 MAG: N-acyl-D-amino-acid deacylase [Candidatus Moranbacteria bacterium GW2011_GWD2_37_9]HBO1678